MDAFDRNKFNELEYVKSILANSVIVSYGTITAIDFDSVVVTQAVSNTASATRIRCTFMNLGSELFTVGQKPVPGMRVLVLSPNKATEGMYEESAQIRAKTGQDYISAPDPSSYSSQLAMCFPAMKATSQAINSILISKELLAAEMSTEIITTLNKAIEIDLKGDTNIEYHEGTNHTRGFYGDLEQTFGMVQGIGGAEKPGTYVYKETYGKHSSVEKNYESGIKTVIGKAYEKPFLDDKGALIDSSAPVTIEMGTGAPVTLKFGAPLNIAFGDDVITISADETGGLDIAVTGSGKVSISAESGKFAISNSTGSLKDLIDKVADLFTNMTTIGPAVVPGSPYTAAATPATALLATEIKTLAAGLLE